MTVKQLLLQYARYNQWAHKNLLDLMNMLSTEQQHRTVASSFNSLYKTVFHIWAAESLWLARLKPEPVKISGDPFGGSMEYLSGALETVDHQWMEWFAAKQDSQLSEKVHYTSLAGQAYYQPYDLLLLHVFNHNTYHNGQLVTILRALAVEKIPSTDFVTWTRLAGTEDFLGENK
jgi:uncharacterized damage-inducible protein DinB